MFDSRRWLLRNPLSFLALAALGAVAWIGARENLPWMLALVAALAALLVSSHLRVRVAGEDLRITYFPFWRRRIALADIEGAEVVRYRWWRAGGWGIRFGDGAISYTVWERRVVRIRVRGKRDVQVGVSDPEGLREAVSSSTSRRR